MATPNFNDLNLIRRKNQMNVFSLLRKKKQSCNSLIKVLDISKVSIYNVLEDLLRLNIIKTQIDQTSKIGRKPTLYSLNAEFGLFAAIDFSQACICIDLFDIFGKVVEHRQTERKTRLDKNDIYAVADMLKDMVSTRCSEKFPLHCICIATPGRIDKKTGYFWLAARFTNSKEINLEQIFRKAFHCCVIVKNDINLAAAGINTHASMQSVPNSLLLHIDNSIGASLYLNGECYEGEHNTACEFGSMLLFDNALLISKIALQQLINKYESLSGKLVTLEKFIELYQQDDPIAEQIFDEYVSTISVALHNFLVMIDISTVIFSGSICLFGEKFLNCLQKHLHSNCFFVQPHCMISPLGNDAILVGCIETALTVGINYVLNNE